EHLHYRMVDVSSVKELLRRWYPRVYFASPEKHGGHRALADSTESIRELRYFRAAAFVPPPGPDSATAKAIAADSVAGGTGFGVGTPTEKGRAKHSQNPAVVCWPRGPTTVRLRGRGGCTRAGRAPGCGPGCRGFTSRHSPQGPRSSDRGLRFSRGLPAAASARRCRSPSGAVPVPLPAPHADTAGR